MRLTSCLLVLGICLVWDGHGNFTATNQGQEHSCKDEERVIMCPPNSVCNETSGRYFCTCKPGFEPEGNVNVSLTYPCNDINECTTSMKGKCGANTDCNNTPGSYYCSCVNGYKPKSGKEEFKNLTEERCIDIDECKNNSTICGSFGKCINIPGNYMCKCHTGFWNSYTNENTLCKDIDECKNNSTICGSFGKCINIPGSYMCKCHTGFRKSNTNENTLCKDVDECANGSTICGINKKCQNLPGNYCCSCEEEYISSGGLECGPKNTTCLKVNCRSSTTSQSKTRCALSNRLLCDLEGIIASAEPTCGSFQHQQIRSRETLQKLLDDSNKLMNKPELKNNDQKSTKELHQLATNMLQSIEKSMANLAQILPMGKTELSSDGAYVQIWKSNDKEENIAIAGNSAQMILDRKAARGKRDEGFAVAGLFSFKSMRTILSGATHLDAGEQKQIQQPEKKVQYDVISDVVTAFVSNDQPYNLTPPIKFTFALPTEVENNKVVQCSYRKIVGNTSFWSTEGCKKTEASAGSVTCECTHLSSFAVLMALYDVESWSLDIITKVGLSLSLVCLLLSIVTFMFCRSLQGTRNTIHLHLCVSLFLAYAIFLAGISRADNKVACSIVAGLLHYFFLASFCWMCLEGVELYLMVVKVFKTNAMKKRYMILAGYGLPLVVVAISAAVRSSGYGTEKHCWLSLEHGFIWSFLAPVCLIILLNAVIFIITVWRLAQKFSIINPDISELKKFRTFTITAIAQLCLLGCTWIIGIFQFNQHTMTMSYLFTILNCLQGAFIFVLHCLMKKQVRDECRRWFCAAVNLKTPSSYDKFSSSGAFSRSRAFSSSTSQTKALQPTEESGM